MDSKNEPLTNEPLTRAQLRDILRAKVNNCKISRSSAVVRQEKLDKIKTDLDKILETTGITAEEFIKSMATGGLKPVGGKTKE